jgi:pimeloyl-ACP methyl ester carboxylesterase
MVPSCLPASARGQPPAARPAGAPPAAGQLPAKTGAPAALPGAQTLEIPTSDGLTLAAAYYPPMPDVDRLASVLLVHDLGGSHATVEPLAQVLQRVGCDVLAPDLRGHGASLFRKSGDKSEARPLRKPDFDMIVLSNPNQQVREQATIRGDLEASLLALLERAGDQRPPVCVVGCGLGGTLATLWTNSDWAWRRLTTGDQGRNVKGLVLVSPVWTDKGVNIKPALDVSPVRDSLPILILAGTADKDAGKVFDYFERLRPGKTIAVDLTQDSPKADPKALAEKSVFSFTFRSPLKADKLATESSLAPQPAKIIVNFVQNKLR